VVTRRHNPCWQPSHWRRCGAVLGRRQAGSGVTPTTTSLALRLGCRPAPRQRSYPAASRPHRCRGLCWMAVPQRPEAPRGTALRAGAQCWARGRRWAGWPRPSPQGGERCSSQGDDHPRGRVMGCAVATGRSSAHAHPPRRGPGASTPTPANRASRGHLSSVCTLVTGTAANPSGLVNCC
jgi:hypothetical protein